MVQFHIHQKKRKIKSITPPRAWGRLYYSLCAGASNRNTPTCVGKTAPHPDCEGAGSQHPHVRGEDADYMGIPPNVPGTPPRAWGRRLPLCQAEGTQRNTPTGVGKTGDYRNMRGFLKKHPHGRGEDDDAQIFRKRFVETPPRAWGRLIARGQGISRYEKHPHGRGEDTLL